MIQQLIHMAEADNTLRRGECFEVHLGPDGEINPFGQKPLSRFIRDWCHLPGIEAVVQLSRVRWLGLVHDDGVLFVPLDDEVAFAGCMEVAP